MNYLLFWYLCSFSDIRENCWWNASVFMQIETWVRLTQWDMYSVTIACCVGLFFLSQNWIDFFSPEFPCLCSVRQIDGYRKDVCCLLWSTWYSKLDIGRFLWSFYVLLKYFFITLEKMLYFFNLAPYFFLIHFLNQLYKSFKRSICCLLKILAKLPMHLRWDYSFGVRMSVTTFSLKCTLENCPFF